MRQEDIWDDEVARDYDRSDSDMFAPGVLGPTVDRLAELAGAGAGAGAGRALEFAVGTGRVAIPLAQRGVRVTGIELSEPMIRQLRTKADEDAVPVIRGDMATTRGPGGRFVIELGLPELRVMPPGQSAVVFASSPGYIGLDTYDVAKQHLISHHFYFDESRQARLVRSPHRYIWPGELDLMGQLAGFELESRHADWVGGEFTAESASHVSVYRLPTA